MATFPESLQECKMYFPPVTDAFVLSVYDGDTITVAAQVHGDAEFYKFSIRLMGLDTPEIRSADPDVKNRAKFVRDQLRAKILRKHVKVKVVHEKEKYGRLLAFIVLGDENINEWMLANNYAKPYDGGKKSADVLYND